MIRYILMLLMTAGLFVGCAATNTRDRAFTDDWATHQRRRPPQERHTARDAETKDEERVGPATITRDEAGRPQMRVGDRTGLGADFDYRRGPAGRLRYRHEWDFGRPRRNQ